MIQFNAHFDGKNLCPEEPVSLPENVSLRVTVAEPGLRDAVVPEGPLGEPTRPTLAERFKNIIGVVDDLPEDMAENHDHYLHGTPKR